MRACFPLQIINASTENNFKMSNSQSDIQYIPPNNQYLTILFGLLCPWYENLHEAVKGSKVSKRRENDSWMNKIPYLLQTFKGQRGLTSQSKTEQEVKGIKCHVLSFFHARPLNKDAYLDQIIFAHYGYFPYLAPLLMTTMM